METELKVKDKARGFEMETKGSPESQIGAGDAIRELEL